MMTRTPRVVTLTMVAAFALAACHKKPETAVPPTSTTTAPGETCNAACRAAKADSIRRADSTRAADLERARLAAMGAGARAAREALLAKLYFDYDAADVSPENKVKLDAKIPVLRANPAIRIRISGHADERGSDEYNLALGQRRAAVAKRYLTDQGIDPSRIETVSYGEQRPAVDGHDESAWRMNRRDEFEITAGGDRIVGDSNGK